MKNKPHTNLNTPPMSTVNDKSNYPPRESTLKTSTSHHKDRKHFKVFSSLQQYITAIQQIRVIDQLMRPTSKNQKQQILKRVNAILLEIKQEMDEIQLLCKYFIGKEQMFVEAELITVNQWKTEIKKIDRMMNALLDFINENCIVLGNVFNLETKVFNVGAKQWRRKCEAMLKDVTCSCMKV